MSNLLNTAIAEMSAKQSNRIKNAVKQASEQPQTAIAQITGFDKNTGSYIATTPDGGENYVQLGNFGAPPDNVSIITTQGATTYFADFRAAQ